MNRAVIALLFCFVPMFAAAVAPLDFRDAAEEKRFQSLARELRCLVCQNQNLADSDASLAGDLRLEVYEQMRAGKSDAEIKRYLVDRYSGFVLYDPPLNTGTVLLWFGPAALLLAGVAALVVIVRRRAAAAATSPVAPIDAAEEDW